MLFLISVNDISQDLENLEKFSKAKLCLLLEIEEMAKFSPNHRFWNDLSQICHKPIIICCDEVGGLLIIEV